MSWPLLNTAGLYSSATFYLGHSILLSSLVGFHCHLAITISNFLLKNYLNNFLTLGYFASAWKPNKAGYGGVYPVFHHRRGRGKRNMRFRASKLYSETKSKIVEILVEKDNIYLFSQSEVLFSRYFLFLFKCIIKYQSRKGSYKQVIFKYSTDIVFVSNEMLFVILIQVYLQMYDKITENYVVQM